MQARTAPRAEFDTIDLYLIRVLHTVITERSVSRAAVEPAGTRPAVSAQLGRLRALTGDPRLVRAGHPLQPTEVALQLAGPAAVHRASSTNTGRRRAWFRHDPAHAAPSRRWLREQVREVARPLRGRALPKPAGAA